MTSLTQWWHERARFPSSRGFLRLPDSPQARGRIEIVDDPLAVWQFGAALIAQYEQNLQNQFVKRYHLRHIPVFDGLRKIPLCPSPDETETVHAAPEEFRALALLVSYGMHEVWFVLRLRRGGNGVDWRMDTVERLSPWVKWPLISLCLGWLSWVLWVFGNFVHGMGGVFGAIVLVSFLASAVAGEGAAGCLWAVVAWPFYLLSGGKQKREERAEENMPGVLSAWQQAQVSVEDACVSVQTRLRISPSKPTPTEPPSGNSLTDTNTPFQPKNRD